MESEYGGKCIFLYPMGCESLKVYEDTSGILIYANGQLWATIFPAFLDWRLKYTFSTDSTFILAATKNRILSEIRGRL